MQRVEYKPIKSKFKLSSKFQGDGMPKKAAIILGIK